MTNRAVMCYEGDLEVLVKASLETSYLGILSLEGGGFTTLSDLREHVSQEASRFGAIHYIEGWASSNTNLVQVTPDKRKVTAETKSTYYGTETTIVSKTEPGVSIPVVESIALFSLFKVPQKSWNQLPKDLRPISIGPSPQNPSNEAELFMDDW